MDGQTDVSQHLLPCREWHQNWLKTRAIRCAYSAKTLKILNLAFLQTSLRCYSPPPAERFTFRLFLELPRMYASIFIPGFKPTYPILDSVCCANQFLYVVVLFDTIFFYVVVL